jgi:hypothetical protein
VNGFHVHAVGWILIFNASACTPQEARGLTRLWEEVVRAHGEDVSAAPLFRRVMQTRSVKLSERTAGALARLIRSMVFFHPERFGWEALRKRRNSWVLQMLLGFVLCGVAARVLPYGWPLLPELVPTLFLLGCLCVIPTVLLWRAASAVRYCSREAIATESGVRGESPGRNIEPARRRAA